MAIAAITVAELKVGVELASDKRRVAREEFVAAVVDAVSIEAYDLDVAETHAVLLTHTHRTGRLRGAHDLIIAATARARKREVVTGDIECFTELPDVVIRR